MEEIWKDVDGYNEYQVSNFGRVKSFRLLNDKRRGTYGVKKELILIPNKIKGYHHVKLKDHDNVMRCVRVHRLVALAFIHNPGNRPHVNHINGIRHDNNVSNLEWCTPSENMRHAYKIGHKIAPYKGQYDRPVLAIKDTAIIEYHSIRQCAIELSLKYTMLRFRIDKNIPLNGFMFYSTGYVITV